MIGAPTQIREIVRRARVFNFRQLQEDEVDEGALLREVDLLFRLLDERAITYVLVGGIALLHYIPGRNTEDIDLIVALAALDQLPEVQLEAQSEYFVQGKMGQLKIDFLLTKNRLFGDVARHYTTVQDFAGRQIRCATVEGLLLLKLYALPSLYRQGDFARVGLYENDVATLMQSYRPDTQRLLTTLETYVSATDSVAVYEIVADIERRIARFERGMPPRSNP